MPDSPNHSCLLRDDYLAFRTDYENFSAAVHDMRGSIGLLENRIHFLEQIIRELLSTPKVKDE